MHFDLLLPALGATGVADPARRHLQPLRHRDAARARRLGPVQRHRGRRPRHPAAPRGLPDGDDRLHDAGGGQLRGPATGSGSAAAGSRATSRPGWCTCATRPRCCAQTGLRGFLGFNLTMGSAFVLLLNPIFWALTTLYVFTPGRPHRAAVPGRRLLRRRACCCSSATSSSSTSTSPAACSAAEFGLTRTALLSPLYWGLMSWAAWKGFIQLFTNPFYWEKTEHGLDDGSRAVDDDPSTVVHTKDRLSRRRPGRPAQPAQRRRTRRRWESLARLRVLHRRLHAGSATGWSSTCTSSASRPSTGSTAR